MSHLEKFRPAELAVAQFSHWIVTVRPKQVTAGDLVVLPLEPIAHFSDVSASAAVELIEVLGRLEGVALGRLGANRINVIAAMMKDPFVHFHFFPRYEGPRSLFGHEWVDADWPAAVTLRDVETSAETLNAVKAFYHGQF